MALPPALSEIGPKLFIDRMNTAVQSMPIVADAVPYSPAANDGTAERQ